MNDYIMTYTGKKFRPLEPDLDLICIEDIAHSLSLQCRFTGHCRYFFSVGSHSLLVSLLLKDSGANNLLMLWGLLHDAAETYLTDVASPLKHQPAFQPYRDAESTLMAAICMKFNLSPAQPPEVHEADLLALSAEAHQLMGDISDWNLVDPPKGIRISPVAPVDVEYEFREIFRGLYGK